MEINALQSTAKAYRLVLDINVNVVPVAGQNTQLEEVPKA